MLALDDARWHQLRTGYSPAYKFLPALVHLQQNPAGAPQIVQLFLDENHVCHQYTVYETTVAVVPHFIYAARRLPAANRRELLSAAGFYAMLLGVPLVADEFINVPPDIAIGYDQAVLEGWILTGETLACPWKEKELAGLLVAVAGFQGHQRRHNARPSYQLIHGSRVPLLPPRVRAPSRMGQGLLSWRRAD